MITTTYLEMMSAQALRPKPSKDPLVRIVEAREKQWEYNRFLYALVGARWQWRDKASWSDEHWIEYANSQALRTFVLYYDGTPAGYFELSKTSETEVELAYFGLAPQFIGRGLGGPLLTAAIEEAWKMGPKRVWVHTCTLDHPNALVNYQARGFTVYKVESA